MCGFNSINLSFKVLLDQTFLYLKNKSKYRHDKFFWYSLSICLFLWGILWYLFLPYSLFVFFLLHLSPCICLLLFILMFFIVFIILFYSIYSLFFLIISSLIIHFYFMKKIMIIYIFHLYQNFSLYLLHQLCSCTKNEFYNNFF